MAGIFKYRKWKSLPLTATMEWLINGYNEEQGGDLNGYNGMTDLTATRRAKGRQEWIYCINYENRRNWKYSCGFQHSRKFFKTLVGFKELFGFGSIF
jgi:hypothetical protein